MKTIVVPLDGSLFSERALPYAAELAEATSTRLVLLRAAEVAASVPALLDPIDAKFDALDEAEAELAATVARLFLKNPASHRVGAG